MEVPGYKIGSQMVALLMNHWSVFSQISLQKLPDFVSSFSPYQRQSCWLVCALNSYNHMYANVCVAHVCVCVYVLRCMKEKRGQ